MEREKDPSGKPDPTALPPDDKISTSVQATTSAQVSTSAASRQTEPELVRLSSFLHAKGTLSKEVINQFHSTARQLSSLGVNRGKRDSDWLDDNILNAHLLRAAELEAANLEFHTNQDSASLNPTEIPSEAARPQTAVDQPSNLRSSFDENVDRNLKIKLNELVKKPEVSDGVKPHPHR